jgi:putative nucleotidyltransferase with HDIG domain
VSGLCRRSVRYVINVNDARETARKLLEAELPRRWAHTQGVARRARSLEQVLGQEAEVIEVAAWLHDIGYASSVASTGFHSLDGARYLRDVLRTSDQLCRLVAHHTGASIEAEERGMAPISNEFAPPPAELLEALTYCDMTTGVDGTPTNVEHRLAEILKRYATDHVVHRSITRSAPILRHASRAMEGRLAIAGRSDRHAERCPAGRF